MLLRHFLHFLLQLALLARAGPGERRARFRCVAAYAAGVVERTCEGICEGTIIGECRGGGGFGYDPLFFHAPTGGTFAELSREEKQRWSHRGRALARLLSALRAADESSPLSLASLG